MTDFIRREDIIKWIDDSLELCGSRYSTEQANMMELFRTVINDCLPFADVVEVVRCKECRSYNRPRLGFCEMHLARMHGDDFCSYGEKMEEDDG